MNYITVSQYVDIEVDLDDIMDQLDEDQLEKEYNKRTKGNPLLLSVTTDKDNGHTRELIKYMQHLIDTRGNHLELTNELTIKYGT